MPAYVYHFKYRRPDGAIVQSKPYVIEAASPISARARLVIAFKRATQLLAPWSGCSHPICFREVPLGTDEYVSDELDRLVAKASAISTTH